MSYRRRLMLLAAVAVALAVALASVATYVLVRAQLRDSVDDGLRSLSERVATAPGPRDSLQRRQIDVALAARREFAEAAIECGIFRFGGIDVLPIPHPQLPATMRKRDQAAGATAGFRVPGHPWTTVAFIVVCAVVTMNTVYRYPENTLIGFAILAAGIDPHLSRAQRREKNRELRLREEDVELDRRRRLPQDADRRQEFDLIAVEIAHAEFGRQLRRQANQPEPLALKADAVRGERVEIAVNADLKIDVAAYHEVRIRAP